MDEPDDAIAKILSGCRDEKELPRLILKHATIVQYLVCRMASDVNQSETGIRTLYATWADLAVERFQDQRTYSVQRLH